MRVLVHGLAVAGASTVRALRRHGDDVGGTDARIDDTTRERAASLDVEVGELPDELDDLLSGIDLGVPAPGVPETHRLIVAAQAAGVPLASEIELAYRWEQDRPGGPRPILAVTGTDGKTTTTDLTVAVLRAAGLRAESLGNTDLPLVDAVDVGGDPDGDGRLDVLVVECTSFRLAWTEQFRADAAVWLNLAPDHLNWHASMDTYEAAKARLFDLQRPDDVAIGFVDDPVVMRHLAAAPGRRRTFGRTGADYRLEGTTLTGPDGPIADTTTMRRSLPHDVTNALAASALVLETGLATPDAISRALATFEAPPHRLEVVGERDGVTWYNDSKATTPHAAATAIRAFDSLVLIAGGSRKGVDLAPMAAEPWRVRTVVAIGEAAPDVHAAFDEVGTVVDAGSMADAISLAADRARPGDAVVLSPGCASFDWYTGYPARGDDFRRRVLDHLRSTDPTATHGSTA
jgi:UDP-N-acetylmuramoylalanine--D-glutamate ligase